MNTRSALRLGVGFGIGLMWVAARPALAADVTFQVNMSAQISLGNFNPATDTVFVAGDPLNGWSTTASPLAASPGDAQIYVGTYEVAGTDGATGQYKFLFTTGGGTTTWEGNVGSGGGTGNRTLTISSTNQTLPVVYFNNVTSGTTVSSAVTFQVDMSVQIEMGAFDPDTGTVSLAGEFNSWNATEYELTRGAGTSTVWAGTRTLTGAAGSAVQYKYVMNGGTWEGNVGTGGAQNRALTLTNGPVTLPLVYFNNLAAIPTNIPVTFQVNLAVPIAQGTFDPDAGVVSVAGDLLNNWSADASPLTRSTTDPNLWTGTFDLNTTAGAVLLYKFVLNGSTWEGDVGPDGTQNRSYTLPNTSPQTLPPAYFNNINNLGTVSLGTLTGNQLSLSWTPGPLIRLQSAASVPGTAWQEVPNTLGQSNATVTLGGAREFFRLAAP